MQDSLHIEVVNYIEKYMNNKSLNKYSRQSILWQKENQLKCISLQISYVKGNLYIYIHVYIYTSILTTKCKCILYNYYEQTFKQTSTKRRNT